MYIMPSYKNDHRCDLMLWKSSGYQDKDEIRKKFANLSKMSYKTARNRSHALQDYSNVVKDELVIVPEYSNRDQLAIYDKDCDKLIIAYRGTDITNENMNRNRDLWSDLYIALGYSHSSRRYIESEAMLTKAMREYGKDHIVLTGHSMGGKVAFELSKEYSLPAIAFNQFSSPLETATNDYSTHFTTNQFSSIDPLSISSTILDEQKVINVDVKEGNTKHTIDNFLD